MTDACRNPATTPPNNGLPALARAFSAVLAFLSFRTTSRVKRSEADREARKGCEDGGEDSGEREAPMLSGCCWERMWHDSSAVTIFETIRSRGREGGG